MSYTVHGVIHLRVPINNASCREDAISQFKIQNPQADVQGVVDDSTHSVFVGTCEICRGAIFQDNDYTVTRDSVRHSGCSISI